MATSSVLICAGAGAACITLVELAYRNQRHPFGDRKQKALLWWLSLIAIDSLLAAGIVFGLSEFEVLRIAPETVLPAWAQGLVMGALGPLALRSPIRTKEIRNEQASIGLTYIYDIVRLYIFFAVDERMVRLRRADVTDLRLRWMGGGVGVDDVADYLRKHIDDHPQLPEEAKEETREAVKQSLTLPTEEQQVDALIKLLRARRFSSVRDHFTDLSERSSAGRH